MAAMLSVDSAPMLLVASTTTFPANPPPSAPTVAAIEAPGMANRTIGATSTAWPTLAVVDCGPSSPASAVAAGDDGSRAPSTTRWPAAAHFRASVPPMFPAPTTAIVSDPTVTSPIPCRRPPAPMFSARRPAPIPAGRPGPGPRAPASGRRAQQGGVESELPAGHRLPEADEPLPVAGGEEGAGGLGELPATTDGLDVPGVAAALLEGDRPLVGGPDAAGQYEDAVIGQQGQVGCAHGRNRPGGRPTVVDRTFVLVDQGDGAPAEGRALVVTGRDPLRVGPDGAEAGVVVDGDGDVVAPAVQLEVEGDPEGDRPVALQHVPLPVDAQHLLGSEFLPQEHPRVAQQRPVGLAVGDVAGQVVVVTLAPQRPRQQGQLLARGEVREEAGPGGRRAGGHGLGSGGRGQR